MKKRSVHIHIHHAATRDSKWTGTYSARKKDGKKIEFTATVEAPDAYVAGDKLKELAVKKHGEDLYYPVVRFNRAERRLPASSLGARVAAAAGPEEDAAFDPAKPDARYPVDMKWLEELPRTAFFSWAGFKHLLMKKLGIDDGRFNDWDVPGDWQQAWKKVGQRKFK